MPRLKARRGAVVVLVGLMVVALTSIAAISIDFSRLWALRNELQTVADAAAHAGAIQLQPPNNAGLTDSMTRVYAARNTAMNGAVTVDSVQLGDWDNIAKTFTPGAATTDAVNVVVSRQSSGLIMAIVGVAPPRLKARAVGWADAPVANADGCIKPWAVPYVTLMYRLNLYHNTVTPGTYSPPDSWANLTRPFDQVADIAALGNMTVAQRTFNLKLGSTNNGTNTVNDSVSGTMPGNYQAVILPKIRDAAGNVTSPTPQGGANNYRDNIAGGECNSLMPGDVLATQPGNMTNPTIQGAAGQHPAVGPGVCDTIKGEAPDNTNINDPTFGDCLDATGVPPDIKAAFYLCLSGCGGASEVTVQLLGSFTLLKLYPKQKNGVFEKAEIVGVFKPIPDAGSVGPGSTTLVRPIIAR